MIKKQIIFVLTILICAGLCYAAAVTHDPWDGTGWNTSAPNDEALVGNTYKELYDLRKGVEMRANREHLTYASSSVGGWHLNGSAVCYEGTTAEPNLPDDSAALSNIARDRGRLWLDDNFDPPVLKRWDGTAYEVIGTIAAGTAPKAYLNNTTEEDGDGGRESHIRAYGEKSGGEQVTLGYIAFAHDGASDDDKGKFSIFLNDGDDANAPSKEVLKLGSDLLMELLGAVSFPGDLTINTNKFTVTAASGNTLVAGTLDVTGNIDPTTYETTNGGFLNHDSMTGAADNTVASSDSIAKYATLDAGGVLMHDAEGGFTNADVNGVKTKVYTKYFTGTLDADASTNVAHGITGIDNILHVSASVLNGSGSYLVQDFRGGASDAYTFELSYNGTNVVFAAVGATVQGEKYRVRIDYIL